MERRKFIGNFRRNMSRVNEYSNIAELLDTNYVGYVLLKRNGMNYGLIYNTKKVIIYYFSRIRVKKLIVME